MKTVDEYIAEYLESKVHYERLEQVHSIIALALGADKPFPEWFTDSDFYIAPASSKHHLHELGGLVQHTINVFNKLLKINHYDDEQCARLALFHDLCKINLYKHKLGKTSPYYTFEELEWRKCVEAFYKDSVVPIDLDIVKYFNIDIYDKISLKKFLYGAQRGKSPRLRITYDITTVIFEKQAEHLMHGHASVIVALKHGIKLTEGEEAAIAWHMGFDDKNWFSMRSQVLKKHYQIIRDLQRADQDATHEEKEND